VDRDQPFLLPPSMAEWLPETHLVWFIIDAVGQLDTAAFHTKAQLGGVGRRGYDPDMLLTLLVYAMAHGQRSSRRIEALCHTDVAYRIICASDVPDHTVIARFRQTHHSALADLLTATLELAAQLGMIRLGVVAFDGVKIAGNASRDANRSENTLRRLATEHLAAAAATDAAEDAQYGHDKRGDELPEKLHDRTHRGARIRHALDEIAVQAAAAQAATAAQEATAAAYTRQQEQTAVTGGRAPMGRRPVGVDPVEAAKATWQRERARRQEHIDAWQAKVAAGARPTGPRPGPVDEYCRVRAAYRVYQQTQAQHTTSNPNPDADPGAASGPTTGKRPRKNSKKNKAKGKGRAPHRGSSRPRDKKPRANLTDPQSRLLHTRNGWIQGYNCPTATSQDRFIIHADATQDANDVEQFEPIVEAVTDLADHLSTTTNRNDFTIGDMIGDAGFDSDTNLNANGPPRLIPNRNYRTTPPAGAPPPAQPPPDATARERMDHRLRTPEGQALYRQRAPQAEASHAWLKDRRGVRHFIRRGLDAARSEIRFAAAVTNLLRIRTLTT
jgi:transposase